MSKASCECPSCGAPNRTIVFELAAQCWRCRAVGYEARLRAAGIDPRAWLARRPDVPAPSIAPARHAPVAAIEDPPPLVTNPVLVHWDPEHAARWRRHPDPIPEVAEPPARDTIPDPIPRFAAVPAEPAPVPSEEELHESRLRDKLGRPGPEYPRTTLPDAPPHW